MFVFQQFLQYNNYRGEINMDMMINKTWNVLEDLHKDHEKPVKISRELSLIQQDKNTFIIERYISVVNDYNIDHFGFSKPIETDFLDQIDKLGKEETRKDAFIISLRNSKGTPMLYVIDRGTKLLLSKGITIPSRLVRNPDKAINHAKNKITKKMI